MIEVVEVALITLADGQIAIVDKEDVHTAARFLWNVSTEGYVSTGTGRKGTLRYLHLMIGARLFNQGAGDCGEEECEFISHKNRNRLDCRRANLRQATRSQSTAFRKLRRDNTSGSKGVTWDKSRNRWRVQICYQNKMKFLGRYNDFDQASRVYDEAAIELFGEFACTNSVLAAENA